MSLEPESGSWTGRSEVTKKVKAQGIQKVLVDHSAKLKNKRSTAGFRLNNTFADGTIQYVIAHWGNEGATATAGKENASGDGGRNSEVKLGMNG